MKKESSGQRFDDDILRCKEEILRLKSVVPPFGRPPRRVSGLPVAVRQYPEPVIEKAPLPIIETSQPVIDAPSEPIETAAESIEQTAIQIMIEEIAAQPSIQNVAFEPEFDDISAKEDNREETEPPVEDSGILAALEAEAAKTDPAPAPEPEFKPEPESESELESEPDDESEIPEFNLAEQIMAAQRKVVGNRRKGPGSVRFETKEVEQQPTPTPPAAPIRIVAMEAPMSPQQKVIADIVARDINKYYQTRKVS